MIAKNPLVSIIVTNYNGKKYLQKCFDSLLKQTYAPLELILADNCSQDNSVKFVEKNYPQVKIFVNEENAGLALTSNRGARLTRGEYLLFYNNDTIASPYFIAEMVKKAKKDKKIGVVCPRQLPYRPEDDTKRTEDERGIGVGSDIYGYICTVRDAHHIFYPDAAIFIRADLFRKIKGFDPNFFLYGEDMDICWRVHLLGYKIVPVPKAKFRHDSACAITKEGRIQTTYKRRYLVERQVINKIFKYYESYTLMWLLPKFLFYYSAEALFFLILKFDYRMFFGVYLKAILWNLGKIKNIARNRKYIQRIRKVDDKYILKLMYPRYRKLDAALKIGIPKIK